jgi:N-acetylglutamate synthase
MLGPQDVGFRVVVRRVVGVRDGRPLFTDVLGDLVTYAEDELTIDGKNGLESVPRAAIVAGKRIPPRPAASGGPDGAAAHPPSS